MPLNLTYYSNACLGKYPIEFMFWNSRDDTFSEVIQCASKIIQVLFAQINCLKLNVLLVDDYPKNS